MGERMMLTHPDNATVNTPLPLVARPAPDLEPAQVVVRDKGSSTRSWRIQMLVRRALECVGYLSCAEMAPGPVQCFAVAYDAEGHPIASVGSLEVPLETTIVRPARPLALPGELSPFQCPPASEERVTPFDDDNPAP